MRVGASGALVPVRGFSRGKSPLGDGRSVWLSHDGLVVISALEQSHLPGSGDPPIVGPQWLVSVSRPTGGDGSRRCRVTDDDLRRVVDCFDMPAFDEDNHHPGIARHLWCPVDETYRTACECRITETEIDDDGYVWTTDRDGPCRGCEYQQMTGMACTIHAGAVS